VPDGDSPRQPTHTGGGASSASPQRDLGRNHRIWRVRVLLSLPVVQRGLVSQRVPQRARFCASLARHHAAGS
jgi:hypothetical protein